MDTDRLKEKLTAAGCCITSAGVIAVSTQQLISSFIDALETIERLEGELLELTPERRNTVRTSTK